MNTRRDVLTAVVLGSLFLALYALTVPKNHAEADNAFHYAWQVEHMPFREALHPHHLFYVPLAKAVHGGLNAVGLHVRAHPAMIGLSMISAVAVVVLAFLTLRLHLGFSREVAVFAAGLIGASYGFWRYACEAEIPTLTAAALMLSLFILSERSIGVRGAALGALAAAAAILLHILSVIPALLAFPAMLMGRGRRTPLLVFILVVIALVVAGYAVTNVSPLDPAADPYGACGDVFLTMRGPSAIGNAAIGFGQSVLSGNAFFCLRPFREFMTRVFSHRMLREEILMGEHAGHSAAFLPLVLLALLALVALLVADDRLGAPADSGPPVEAPLSARRSFFAVMTLWFLLRSLVQLGYQPANPEGWIVVTIPFWFGLVLLWARDRRGIPTHAMGTLFVLTLLYNYFGGMALLGDPGGDYHQVKSAWILSHTRDKDAILTAENAAYYWYLRYHAPCEVITTRTEESQPLLEAVEAVRQRGGHVLAGGDVFDTAPDDPHLVPLVRDRIIRNGEILRPHFRPVGPNGSGEVQFLAPAQATQ